MKYFLIGDEEAHLGFGMIGVEGRAVENRAEADEAFRAALSDEEVGIILFTEGAAALIRDKVDDYLFNRDFPLILEIPSHSGPSEDRRDLRDLVNNAIGMKL